MHWIANLGAHEIIHRIHRNPGRYASTNLGFDDFVNMVLENVTEHTPEGETKLSQILLNGSNIALLVPGGQRPE